MELGRFSYYAVRKGFVPGVYDKWEDCRKQVEGFSGNEYKGFNVRAEAEQWMRGEPLRRDGSRSRHRRIGGSQSPKPSWLLERVIFFPLNVNQRGSSSRADGSGGDTVARKQQLGFVHVEDMELMLLRACLFFGIGDPMYVHQETGSTESCVMFEYMIILRDKSLGLDLQNAEEAVSNEIDSLRQRIKRLEEEKEDLMNQVEMFNEVLDDS
ncbi:uncharacterized protein LOC130966446 [Arachis stenosperma]|uniref:uncharacterized protein LOC130966446 n=1 Tax=Arachis stenosperma TaxID=217475 RepID=UPI0025AC5415|nr:uncharacterized protein LOC130966446 [Arachis stenosperma]